MSNAKPIALGAGGTLLVIGGLLLLTPKVVVQPAPRLDICQIATNLVLIHATNLTAGHTYRLQQGHLHNTNWIDASSNFLAPSGEAWFTTKSIQIAFGPAPFPGPASQLDTNPPSRYSVNPSSLAKLFRLKDVTP